MPELKPHFAIADYQDAISKNEATIIGSNYRITVLSEVLVRIEYSDTGTFEDRPTELVRCRNFDVPKYTKLEDANFLTITTNYFKLEYAKGKPFFGPKGYPDQHFKINLINTDKRWYFNHPEARNFKGTSVSLDGVEGKTTYAKGLYSTDGFVSIDDANSLIFNIDGSLGKRSDNRIDTYVFLYRKDFGFCLRDYFKLTGKPALIPRYALGNWWNKDQPYSTDEIKKLLWNFKKNELPLSVFLMGKKWRLKYEGTHSGFTFNYSLIPNPNELLNILHEKKIKVGLNIDPTGGIHPDDLGYPRFKASANYPNEGIIPFNTFNKQMLQAYFDELIKPLIDIGIDFFWIDYYNPKDLITLRALNHYHFKDFAQFENKRGMILSRNGMNVSHRYPVLYSGYTKVSWNNLDLIPEFNLTSSNIGLSWWSHDIGGYSEGIEDAEMYMRFIQLGVYSPIFRLASAESRYYKRAPWLWDAKTLSIVKNYMKLRHRLIPYIYTEAYKYHKTGLPLIQPLYYKYPEIYDEPTYKNEYYFGSELFIAPITNKKETIMNRAIAKIFIPNGEWYDFKTGKKFMGGKRYVSFFKDEDYPVFAKKGSIIPMSILDLEDINNTAPPKAMEIHIFPGQSNTYKLYEDDGVSSMFEQGHYLITDIDYNYQANNFTVIIRPTDGKSGIVPALRSYKIRFRNTREAKDVTIYLGEEKLEEAKSYVDGNDFVVEVPEFSTSKQVSISCKGKDIEIEAERIINEDIDSIISDLQIKTSIKEEIAAIFFNEAMDVRQKRIAIRKLRRIGLHWKYKRMFISLLEYMGEF